jgi:hypothetical protein
MYSSSLQSIYLKNEPKPERQILSAERSGKRGLALQKYDFSFIW